MSNFNISKILSPIFGADTSKEDQAAQAAIDQGAQTYKDVKLPDLYSPDLVQYQDLGQPSANLRYDLAGPAQSVASVAGDSAFQDVKTDPRLAMSQQDALKALEQISKSGGLTPQDLANLNKVQSEVGQADRGRREAILQNFNARGLGGSGNELLTLLQSNQAATDRASQQGMDINGLAAQRALDAVMQSGNLASQLRSQDFSEKSKAAEAQDLINRFNATNLQSVNNSNAQTANQFALNRAQGEMGANQLNFASQADRAKQAQNIANSNVDIRNQGLLSKAAIPQQQFSNQMSKAGGQTSIIAPTVAYYGAKGDQKSKEAAGYLDALIKGGAAAAKSAG